MCARYIVLSYIHFLISFIPPLSFFSDLHTTLIVLLHTPQLPFCSLKSLTFMAIHNNKGLYTFTYSHVHTCVRGLSGYPPSVPVCNYVKFVCQAKGLALNSCLAPHHHFIPCLYIIKLLLTD